MGRGGGGSSGWAGGWLAGWAGWEDGTRWVRGLGDRDRIGEVTCERSLRMSSRSMSIWAISATPRIMPFSYNEEVGRRELGREGGVRAQ